MHSVVADVQRFQHGVGRQRVLESEVPAERIGALHFRIQKGSGLTQEGLQTVRRSRRRQQTIREWIAECDRSRAQIVVAGWGETGLLTEAPLIEYRSGGVVAILREV